VIAIGNDELGPEAGESIACDKCGYTHPIEFGTSRTLKDDGTWTESHPSKLVGFYRCGGQLYLASLNGRLV